MSVELLETILSSHLKAEFERLRIQHEKMYVTLNEKDENLAYEVLEEVEYIGVHRVILIFSFHLTVV